MSDNDLLAEEFREAVDTFYRQAHDNARCTLERLATDWHPLNPQSCRDLIRVNKITRVLRSLRGI